MLRFAAVRLRVFVSLLDSLMLNSSTRVKSVSSSKFLVVHRR